MLKDVGKDKGCRPNVPAQEAQRQPKRHQGEERDDIEPNEDVLRTRPERFMTLMKFMEFLTCRGECPT
jgi:hypothetical protein